MVGKNTEWKQTSRKLHGTGSLRELFRFQDRLRNRAQRGDDRLCLRECCMQRRGRRSLVGEASLLDGVRGLFRGPLCLDSAFAWSCRCTRARTCLCDSRPAVEVADDRSRYRPDHRRRRKRAGQLPEKDRPREPVVRGSEVGHVGIVTYGSSGGMRGSRVISKGVFV